MLFLRRASLSSYSLLFKRGQEVPEFLQRDMMRACDHQIGSTYWESDQISFWFPRIDI
jgi:hypothetical protein